MNKMIVSASRKIVFLAIPRTGSRSVRAAMLTLPDSIELRPHHLRIAPPELEGCRVFTVVRNPFARMLSHYLYRQARRDNSAYALVSRMSFADYIGWIESLEAERSEPDDAATFVERDPSMTIWLRLCRVSAYLRAEEVARTRTIEIGGELSLQNVPALNANALYRPEGEERRWYTAPLAERVFRLYEEDFAAFGYASDSWNEL